MYKLASKALMYSLFTTLDYIRELIGTEAAKKLCAHYGGTTEVIPSSCDCNRFKGLAVVIGRTPAAILVKTFAGDRIYIAQNAKEQIRLRDEALRRAFDNGATVKELTLTFRYTGRLSERTLRKIKNDSTQ